MNIGGAGLLAHARFIDKLFEGGPGTMDAVPHGGTACVECP